MIDCSFYAVCRLNALLGQVLTDSTVGVMMPQASLFDLVVIFLNICVQGHDAPSERLFDFHVLHCFTPTVCLCK